MKPYVWHCDGAYEDYVGDTTDVRCSICGGEVMYGVSPPGLPGSEPDYYVCENCSKLTQHERIVRLVGDSDV